VTSCSPAKQDLCSDDRQKIGLPQKMPQKSLAKIPIAFIPFFPTVPQILDIFHE
jgi:hypothetical protein